MSNYNPNKTEKKLESKKKKPKGLFKMRLLISRSQ